MFSAVSVWLSVCLSVCLLVCPRDNFRTTKRRTIELGGIGTVYKNLARVRRSRSKVKVTRGKNRKTAELTMHSRACAVTRPYAVRSNRRYHCVPPGGDGLRRWENQRMLSSCIATPYMG